MVILRFILEEPTLSYETFTMKPPLPEPRRRSRRESIPPHYLETQSHKNVTFTENFTQNINEIESVNEEESLTDSERAYIEFNRGIHNNPDRMRYYCRQRSVRESSVPDDRERRPTQQRRDRADTRVRYNLEEPVNERQINRTYTKSKKNEDLGFCGANKERKRSTKYTRRQSENHRRRLFTTVEEQEPSYKSERSNESETILNKTYTEPEEAYQPEYYDERGDTSTNSMRSSYSSGHQNVSSKIHIDDQYPEYIDDVYKEDIDETYPEDIDETYREDIDETYPEDIDETYPEDIDETYPDEIPRKSQCCSRRQCYDTINKKSEIDYQQCSDGLNPSRQNTGHTRCYYKSYCKAKNNQPENILLEVINKTLKYCNLELCTCKHKSEGCGPKDCTCRRSTKNTKRQSENHRRRLFTTEEEQEPSYKSERSNENETILNKTGTKPEEAYQPEYYDERDDTSTKSIRSSYSSGHQDVSSKIHIDDPYPEYIDDVYKEDIDETYPEDIEETYREDIDETYSDKIPRKSQCSSRRHCYDTINKKSEIDYQQCSDSLNPSRQNTGHTRCYCKSYCKVKNNQPENLLLEVINKTLKHCNLELCTCKHKSKGCDPKNYTCRRKSYNTCDEYKSMSCTPSESRLSIADTPPPSSWPTKPPYSPGGGPLPCTPPPPTYRSSAIQPTGRSSTPQCAPPPLSVPIPLSPCTPPPPPSSHNEPIYVPPERPPSCDRKSLKRVCLCEETKSTKEKCPSRKRNPNVEKFPQPAPQIRCCRKFCEKPACPSEKHDLTPIKNDPRSRCTSRECDKSDCSSKSSRCRCKCLAKINPEVSGDQPKCYDRDKCPPQNKKVNPCDDRNPYKPCSTTKVNKPRPKPRKSKVRTDCNPKCDTSHDNSPCQCCEYCRFIHTIDKNTKTIKSGARVPCIDKKTGLPKDCIRCCQDGKTICECCDFLAEAQKTKIPGMVNSPCIDNTSSKPKKVKLSFNNSCTNNACTCNIGPCKCIDRKPCLKVIVDKSISCTSIGTMRSLNSRQCLRRSSAKSILPSKSFIIEKQREIERVKRKKIVERNKPAEPNIKLIAPVITQAKNIKQDTNKQSISRQSSKSYETTGKQCLKKAIESVPSNMYLDVPDIQFILKGPGKKVKILKIKKLYTSSGRYTIPILRKK